MEETQVIAQQKQDNSDEESEVFITFDDLLSTRIGFGIYQIIVLLVVCLIDFIDGSEQYYMMILVQVLQKEWNLNQNQIEILGSFYYIGLFLGAIISGVFCDLFGRKKSMIIGCFIQLGTVVWTAFASDFSHMVAIRTLYGAVIGITLPIGVLIMTEIVPKNIRGRCLILTQSAYMIGKFYLLLLCVIFMDDLSKGNWRAIAICQIVPSLALTIGCIFCLDESPRFLVSHNRVDEAIVILNKIGEKNKKGEIYDPIPKKEIDSLKKWQLTIFSQQPSTYTVLKGLFKGSNLAVSWRLIIANCMNSFMASGTIFLLPFYLHGSGLSFLELFIATLGEIPASIIVYCFIDIQSVGRLRIINITLFVSSVSLFIIFLAEDKFLLAGVTLLKFFQRFTVLCSIPLISESYDTFHRSLGLGLSTALGRAMGIISPFILYEVYLYSKWYVFLIFSILTFISLIIFLSYPIDRTNKPLDYDYSKKQPKSPQITSVQHEDEDLIGLLDEKEEQSTIVSRAALKK